jgi:integrase
MGVYTRTDSPFFWLLLERPGQRAIRESTRIPVEGGTPQQSQANRQVAQEAYAARMAHLARQDYQLPGVREGISFGTYADWHEKNVSVHKRNADRERSMIRRFKRDLGELPLTEVTRERVQEWITARRQAVSASTVNRETELLKHMMGQAVPKYLPANPLSRLGRLRTAKHEARVLTPAEETRLLKVLTDAEDRALILTALDTLIRLTDAVTLKRQQDHGSYLTIVDPKVEQYKVPVSKRLRKALNRLPKTSAWFFPKYCLDGAGTPRSHHARRSLVERMFENACRAARILYGREAHGVTFHCLRHTGASRMLSAGVSVKVVQEIGGWKNLKVLERYLHPGEREKREAVNRIGR